MGQPVVHFEVIGKDGDKLRSYYSELFSWEIDSNNPMKYGMVARDANLAPDGSGIGGGIAGGPDGYEGHVTFYVAVPDIEEALAKAESLGGTRVMGPGDDHGHDRARPVHGSRGPPDRARQAAADVALGGRRAPFAGAPWYASAAVSRVPP